MPFTSNIGAPGSHVATGTPLTRQERTSIQQNTANRHAHSNKPLLDKFTAPGGVLTYDGTAVGTSSSGNPLTAVALAGRVLTFTFEDATTTAITLPDDAVGLTQSEVDARIAALALTAVTVTGDIEGDGTASSPLQLSATFTAAAAANTAKVGNVQSDWDATEGLAEILNRPDSLSAPDATESTRGIVQLATRQDALIATDTEKAVTPNSNIFITSGAYSSRDEQLVLERNGQSSVVIPLAVPQSQGLETVTSDETLHGDGTAASPLEVANPFTGSAQLQRREGIAFSGVVEGDTPVITTSELEANTAVRVHIAPSSVAASDPLALPHTQLGTGRYEVALGGLTADTDYVLTLTRVGGIAHAPLYTNRDFFTQGNLQVVGQFAGSPQLLSLRAGDVVAVQEALTTHHPSLDFDDHVRVKPKAASVTYTELSAAVNTQLQEALAEDARQSARLTALENPSPSNLTPQGLRAANDFGSHEVATVHATALASSYVGGAAVFPDTPVPNDIPSTLQVGEGSLTGAGGVDLTDVQKNINRTPNPFHPETAVPFSIKVPFQLTSTAIDNAYRNGSNPYYKGVGLIATRDTSFFDFSNLETHRALATTTVDGNPFEILRFGNSLSGDVGKLQVHVPVKTTTAVTRTSFHLQLFNGNSEPISSAHSGQFRFIMPLDTEDDVVLFGQDEPFNIIISPFEGQAANEFSFVIPDRATRTISRHVIQNPETIDLVFTYTPNDSGYYGRNNVSVQWTRERANLPGQNPTTVVQMTGTRNHTSVTRTQAFKDIEVAVPTHTAAGVRTGFLLGFDKITAGLGIGHTRVGVAFNGGSFEWNSIGIALTAQQLSDVVVGDVGLEMDYFNLAEFKLADESALTAETASYLSREFGAGAVPPVVVLANTEKHYNLPKGELRVGSKDVVAGAEETRDLVQTLVGDARIDAAYIKNIPVIGSRVLGTANWSATASYNTGIDLPVLEQTGHIFFTFSGSHHSFFVDYTNLPQVSVENTLKTSFYEEIGSFADYKVYGGLSPLSPHHLYILFEQQSPLEVRAFAGQLIAYGDVSRAAPAPIAQNRKAPLRVYSGVATSFVALPDNYTDYDLIQTTCQGNNEIISNTFEIENFTSGFYRVGGNADVKIAEGSPSYFQLFWAGFQSPRILQLTLY